MEGKQIQTLVNHLGRKLANGPDSVSLTEFLVLASTAVVNRHKALLAAGPREQTAQAPSPYTGISPAKGLELVLEGLAQAQGLLFLVELDLASSRQVELAAAA